MPAGARRRRSLPWAAATFAAAAGSARLPALPCRLGLRPSGADGEVGSGAWASASASSAASCCARAARCTATLPWRSSERPGSGVLLAFASLPPRPAVGVLRAMGVAVPAHAARSSCCRTRAATSAERGAVSSRRSSMQAAIWHRSRRSHTTALACTGSATGSRWARTVRCAFLHIKGRPPQQLQPQLRRCVGWPAHGAALHQPVQSGLHRELCGLFRLPAGAPGCCRRNHSNALMQALLSVRAAAAPCLPTAPALATHLGQVEEQGALAQAVDPRHCRLHRPRDVGACSAGRQGAGRSRLSGCSEAHTPLQHAHATLACLPASAASAPITPPVPWT